MVPDAELSIVRERVAKEAAIVRRTGEGYRLMLSHSIDNGVYTVTKTTRGRIKIDTTEVIADGIKLMTSLGKGAGCTEIDRTPIGREDGESLIDGILLDKGREQELILLDVVDLEVGGFIEDLNTVGMGTVKQLSRGVGGISDVVP